MISKIEAAAKGDALPITIADVKEIAKKKLRYPVWRYYVDGADAQISVLRNERIFDELLLRPHILRDVSNIDTSTRIFGKRYSMPIAIGPSAYQKLVGGEGELDVARAARALGTNLTLSSNATTSLEDVAGCLGLPDSSQPMPWFQLYFLRNRSTTADLISRAEAAGYEAIVLTVDTVVLGNRPYERREPLVLPADLSMANLSSIQGGGVSKGRLLLAARTKAESNQVMAEHGDFLVDMGLTWDKTIPWLRQQTSMKIILKGVMTAEDGLSAVEAGVDAIVVSNHGGRQLDSVPSTLEALPEVVKAVNRRIPVIFDGGITRGSDVFKAMALGADLCLIGRSALWGLAWAGQKGVEGVLRILERELWRTMALAGARTLGDIDRTMIGEAMTTGFGVARL